MSEEQNDVKGLESGIDADAGIGPSAEELETHNPDEMDFDQVLKDIESFDDDEEETPGEAKTTDDTSDDEEAGTKDKEVDEDKPVPYGRFKEVNDKYREAERAIARLEGRLEAMERSSQRPEEKETKSQPSPLEELLANEPQAILDALQEDPATFLRNVITAAKNEATTEVETRQRNVEFDNRIKSGLDKFAEEHDDFLASVEKIGRVINENPIHNAISAYAYEVEIPSLKSQLAEMEGKINTAKEEGVKAGRKQVIAEIKAKGAAATLDGSASTQSKSSQANDGIETGGDPNKLREMITQELLKKRAAS